jgi:hypothetical protein
VARRRLTRQTLDDAFVASLVAEWHEEQPDFLVRARVSPGAPAAARVLQSMSTMRDLDELLLIVSGVVEGRMRATDVGGYAFDGDQVVVWDAGDHEVSVSRAAFIELMAKLCEEVLTRFEFAGTGHEDELAGMTEALREGEGSG